MEPTTALDVFFQAKENGDAAALNSEKVLVDLRGGSSPAGSAAEVVRLADGAADTVVVVGVGPHARNAGLGAGTVLLQVNGAAVRSAEGAMRAVFEAFSGGLLELQVERRAVPHSCIHPRWRRTMSGGSPNIHLVVTCSKVTSKMALRRRKLVIASQGSSTEWVVCTEDSGKVHGVVALRSIAELLVENVPQGGARQLLFRLDPRFGQIDMLLQIREHGPAEQLQGPQEGDTHGDALAAAECVASLCSGMGHHVAVRLAPASEIRHVACLAETATRKKLDPVQLCRQAGARRAARQGR
eukprot:TRINITY_DN23027_c0_g1_i1.p1 TRINITY_DN23027_c0_g1~~TRINITY_DN23027_c0_g1_i1.p1  ORF type:complete len:327 (+),score=88.98 TRINITY_DN23027_c0_g1_i1:89-982(+)